MRSAISITDIYTGLKQALPGLPARATGPIELWLESAPTDVLRLGFVPLHCAESAEVHSHSLYAPTASHATSTHHVGTRPDLWIVFEKPEIADDAGDGSSAIPGDRAQSAARDLAKVLEEFHFFAPLTCIIAEIHVCDPDLARNISALQRLRTRCGDELFGHQLTLQCPFAVGCCEPATLRVSGLAPLDSPPSHYSQHRMTRGRPGEATIVVLGERSIQIVADPTVRLAQSGQEW